MPKSKKKPLGIEALFADPDFRELLLPLLGSVISDSGQGLARIAPPHDGVTADQPFPRRSINEAEWIKGLRNEHERGKRDYNDKAQNQDMIRLLSLMGAKRDHAI